MNEVESTQDHAVGMLLLPLAVGQLLLPSVAVVELLPYPETIVAATNTTPDWYAGFFDWRGLSLPLVSWERLTGQTEAAAGQRRRAAVCHVFSADETMPFVALEISALPRLLSVTQADLHVRSGSADPESCILAEARLGDSMVQIPDLDALGRLLVPFSR